MMFLVSLVMFVMGIMTPAKADEIAMGGGPLEAGTELRANELLQIKAKVMGLDDLTAKGIITPTQRQQGLDLYLKQARDLDPAIASIRDVLAVRGGLVSAVESHETGLLHALDVWRVIAGVFGVVCFTALVFYYISDLRLIFGAVPMIVYEALFYALSIGAVVFGHGLERWGVYVGFAGSLGIGGGILMSSALRKRDPNPTLFFALLTVLWGTIALWYSSTLIAFITVMALMALSGFYANMSSLCYVLGFRDDQAVLRSTVIGFAMLAVFIAVKALHVDVPSLGIFETGALFIGSFVGFLGVLIMSSRWYPRSSTFYGALQIIALLSGLGSILAGSVLGVPELQKIGGTFFCLWILEKIAEVPLRTARGWAAFGLALALLVYYGTAVIENHLESIRPYLFF